MILCKAFRTRIGELKSCLSQDGGGDNRAVCSSGDKEHFVTTDIIIMVKNISGHLFLLLMPLCIIVFLL